MTTHPKATSLAALAAATLLATAGSGSASAQNYPITPTQQATANQVAQAGVPLSELAANAPDTYTIKSGDTLWAISKLFLKSPWRWPELWGMNLAEIKNPHRIYPGQLLVLERRNGMATLRVGGEPVVVATPSGGVVVQGNTIRVSPRTRYESLNDSALPTLSSSAIEPFLAEPAIVENGELDSAPRLVAAAQEGRVLLARGDRAYARGPEGMPLLDDQVKQKSYRIFRNATPLKDPDTGEVLAYEAQYLGKASLVRGEAVQNVRDKDGDVSNAPVPATLDIVGAKQEMRVGDRLLPEPPRQLQTYVPRAPAGQVQGRIISVYGSAVVNAAQNQVVAINRGTRDGMEPGYVLAILKDGARVIDKSDEARPLMKLPDERNGLLMVFRTFERVSYGLILDITDTVRAGDRLASPR